MKGSAMFKKIWKRKSHEKPLPSRITNDTMAQHREEVLAGGRKHKYPIQYTKRRLVWITLAVSIAGLALVSAFFWFQLYVQKDTGDISYRVTKLLALPVASISGEKVRYSDYLMFERSTRASLDRQGRADSVDKAKFQREMAMDRALEYAYTRKLARELSIETTKEQVDIAIKDYRDKVQLSDEAYVAVLQENLSWTMDEMRTAVKMSLLQQAVSFAVDEEASKISSEVNKLAVGGKGLQEIVDTMGQKVQYVPTVTVAKDNSDGGLSTSALKLKPGMISEAVRPLAGDGYYFVNLVSTKEDTITYGYIKVPLKAFKGQIENLKNNGGVRYYIDVN